MNTDVVIRIKYDDSTPEEVKRLVEILREEQKPEWRLKLSAWRSGPRALSERAVALMTAAIAAEGGSVQGEQPEQARQGAVSNPPLSKQENLFG